MPLDEGAVPVAHLAAWFIELSDARTYSVIAGMGGGGVIHNHISCLELEAWGRISGNEPTVWELAVLRQMDHAFVAEKSNKDSKGSGKKHQEVGDYCNGKEIDNCRKNFGDGLAGVCATCPD